MRTEYDMKNLRVKLIILILLIFHSYNINASELPQLSSNSVVSLIVCSPTSSYEGTFGHVALRIQDVSLKMDVVFNYGSYDPDQSFFLYKIILGKLGSSLEGERFYDFVQRYKAEGRGIKEYYLNLTGGERQKIWEALNHTLLSENRSYKFNFISNNCTTQARDLLFEQLDLHTSLYNGLLSGYTSREIELQQPIANSWFHLLFQMLLGVEADKPYSIYKVSYSPDGLLQLLKVVNENERTIVSATHELVAPTKEKGYPITMIPVLSCLVLLVIVFFLSYIQYRKERNFLIFDRILFLFSGVLGIFLLSVMLFSEVILLNVNFNIMWLLPTNLILALLIRKRNNKKITVNLARLSVCSIICFPLLSFAFKQQIPVESYILALALLVRLYFYTLMDFKRKK